MTALVEVDDLLVQRGEVAALRLDHLEIHRSEVLAVVGPNGAGKSTLLLTLARLLKPEAGRIRFEGRPAVQQSITDYRRRIALVMQQPLLFDTTVYENAAMGLRFRGISGSEIEDRVARWLARIGVSHLAQRRAGELSGGEAQRVSLARALILEPQLLLLDEPFSSLDPPTREAILADLATLLDETRTTTVFVTHDLREAALLADRMAVVIGGRLRQVGRASDIYNTPADGEVAHFLKRAAR